MELHERLVSAMLGALWGALLGLLLAFFFHYVIGVNFDRGFLILDWKSTILGSAIVFTIIGFIFKASAGTIVGTLMSWVWSAIEHYREIYRGNLWILLFFLAAISFWFYATTKA